MKDKPRMKEIETSHTLVDREKVVWNFSVWKGEGSGEGVV